MKRTSALAREGATILLILSVIAGVYVGVGRWADRQPRAVPPAQPAPPLVLPIVAAEEPEGRVVRLADYAGRSVVLHFWASWCTACIDERPFVDALWRRNLRKPFTVLTVAVNDDRLNVLNTGRATKSTPTVLLDKDGKVAADWAVVELPQTILIDPNGSIALRIKGPLDADRVAALEQTASAGRFIDRTTPQAPYAAPAVPPAH